ncbi:MAG: DUF1343 domain-containing protein [Bacteroidetes bacterium]|nr:DUF1343 domain-containing protein [Bacteroidota bacterium]MBS1649612.1 DUF1343 domain-containing protein [Bacteroidota bacterium]
MILFGIDVLLKNNYSWKKQRIALVTNHAATTNQLEPSRKALLNEGFNIIKLFSPEHGLDIKGADGVQMKDGKDDLTQLPIISLYNKKLQPDENDLNDIDIVLFDIPDIGCRYYTYLWTMTHVLQACGKHNKKLIILDRPNPLSGNLNLTEGTMLDEVNCSSFIGRWNIPLRHSCTLGELALYFNQQKNIHANIEIIQCEGWNRNMFQTDWGMPFVPTSPAIKNFTAALLYPGLGLLEATNISEGRGTLKSFTVAGAVWMNNNLLVENLQKLGIHCKTVQFIPTESKYANELCMGVEFCVDDVSTFQSVKNGLLLIKLVKDIQENKFHWNPYPTNVNPSGKNHLDKLLGVFESEKLFDLSLTHFIQKINELINVTSWPTAIKNYLLY